MSMANRNPQQQRRGPLGGPMGGGPGGGRGRAGRLFPRREASRGSGGNRERGRAGRARPHGAGVGLVSKIKSFSFS